VEECEWCEGKKDCPSFQPDVGFRPGYVCTRESGHRGKHVTCLQFRHSVAVWGEADEPHDSAIK
jgi:hypothetical protein